MNTFYRFLKNSRESFLDRYHSHWAATVFSAETLSLHKVATRLTKQHTSGRTLDAGCGRGTWSKVIELAGGEYESVDIIARGYFSPTYQADLCNLQPIGGERYQTVVCHQVLEHIPLPHLALSEMFRILKPSGKLIITVPHLSRYHELPHDYTRYTEFGLRALAEHTGFQIIETGTYGNLFSFLHHQTSFIFPGILLGIPVISWICLLANACISYSLHGLCHLVGAFRLPVGCYAVLVKSGEATGS